MVKTNCLVKISSIDIPIFADLILKTQLPVVHMDRTVVDQFQGSLMNVDLSVVSGEWVDAPWDGDSDWEADFDPNIHLPPAGTGPRFNLLILGRDWNKFCEMIGRGNATLKGFDQNVKIDIKMNGYPATLPDWKAPISKYFTLERQTSLLGEFPNALRCFKHVSLSGAIDEELALSIVEAVAEPPER